MDPRPRPLVSATELAAELSPDRPEDRRPVLVDVRWTLGSSAQANRARDHLPCTPAVLATMRQRALDEIDPNGTRSACLGSDQTQTIVGTLEYQLGIDLFTWTHG